MTSTSSLSVLLDPAWPALGTDSVGTNARKALEEAGITPAAAAAMKRPDLARTPGLGIARLERVDTYLRKLADAKLREAANVAREAGKGKLGHCPECGDPWATDPRNVVMDLNGTYRAVSQPGGPNRDHCEPCHRYHVRLVAGAAA
jgi:hypothetical protein